MYERRSLAMKLSVVLKANSGIKISKVWFCARAMSRCLLSEFVSFEEFEKRLWFLSKK